MWCCKIILIYLTVYFQLVNSSKEKYVKREDETPRVFFFVFASLAVGGLLRVIFKVLRVPVPYRVVLLLIGGILGVLSSAIPSMKLYTRMAEVKPRYLLTAFLPPLLFKTAFSIDSHIFMRSRGQILFVAVLGVIINACFTGMVMMVLLGYEDWTYAMGFVFGTICSPIYPVEVVSTLKEIGQTKHLSMLLEGEGMLGDASVMILFEILLGIINEDITTWYHFVMVFARYAVGGFLLGYLLGKIMGYIMNRMYSDIVNMLILSMVSAYLTYYIGTETFGTSGVIAVVVLGVLVSFERTSLSAEVESFMFNFWDMLAYIANTMIFLLAGIIISEQLLEYITLQDGALVLVTYVVAGVGRLLEYIILAPIISRLGYGLTLRNMTIAVWSGLKGPVPFCLTLIVLHHENLSSLGRELVVHIAGLVTLTLLINATTVPLLLKLLGLSELTMARQVNMNNCVRHLQNRRDRRISMLKMDRFLADANWSLVNTSTVLKHPYKINIDNDDEEDNYLGFRTTTCPDCQKEIPNEPTNKEMIEMTREARMRILKAKNISYSRQYEAGMLSKDGIRVLSQAVETAMDTPEAIVELEGLHKYFKRQGFMHYMRRRLLTLFFKKSESNVKPPRKYWRRVCYHIVMHPAFDIFIQLCILVNIVPIVLEIKWAPLDGSNLNTSLKVVNTIFFLIYFSEFALKVYGYSWIYICKHGFRTYFRSYWNVFDFMILVVCMVDVSMDYADLFSKQFIKSQSSASKVTTITKLARVIRLIRLLRLCKAWYPKLIKYCDSKIDKHLAFAYDVGKGFVTGEEEVGEMLLQMIDNKIIREDCRLRVEADRLSITKELGMVQKDRPWIAITVKTRQAIRSTINSISEAVLELKVSGWVDDLEYVLLMESVEERLKYARTKIKSVQPSPPRVMFKEVPWMGEDEQISDFLYENVVTKVFDQGDIVCVDGEMADGVYIIVTGLLKLSYSPKKEVMGKLLDYGSLPIIDYISSTRFEEKVEDYIVSGNCIGELSTLTGRPYDCTITADTASQAYILTHEVIKQAIQRSPDPVTGLESKMWKSISIRLATSLLMDTPVYQSTTQEKIRLQLERGFMPNLSNYKVFGVNDMMEDILLIEGVVFDYNTRDCYTAPCYIPRTVQKIVLPKSSRMYFETTVEPKLFIIPAKDVDEFDIMEREEEISEMVSTASVKCLQHLVQDRSSRLKRKRKRQTTFSLGGHRRVKYGESRISNQPSVFYSRSRLTNASSVETEIKNSMYEVDGTLDSYVISEKENHLPDRRASRSTAVSGDKRRGSSVPKRSLKDSTNTVKRQTGQASIHSHSVSINQSPDQTSTKEEEQPSEGIEKQKQDEPNKTQHSSIKSDKLNNMRTLDNIVGLKKQPSSERQKLDVPVKKYGKSDDDDKSETSKTSMLINNQQLQNPKYAADNPFFDSQKPEQESDVKKTKPSEATEEQEKETSSKNGRKNLRVSLEAKSSIVKDTITQNPDISERKQSGSRKLSAPKTLNDLLPARKLQDRSLSNEAKKSDNNEKYRRRSTKDEIERLEKEQRSENFDIPAEELRQKRTSIGNSFLNRYLDDKRTSKESKHSSEEAKPNDRPPVEIRNSKTVARDSLEREVDKEREKQRNKSLYAEKIAKGPQLDSVGLKEENKTHLQTSVADDLVDNHQALENSKHQRKQSDERKTSNERGAEALKIETDKKEDIMYRRVSPDKSGRKKEYKSENNSYKDEYGRTMSQGFSLRAETGPQVEWGSFKEERRPRRLSQDEISLRERFDNTNKLLEDIINLDSPSDPKENETLKLPNERQAKRSAKQENQQNQQYSEKPRNSRDNSAEDRIIMKDQSKSPNSGKFEAEKETADNDVGESRNVHTILEEDEDKQSHKN